MGALIQKEPIIGSIGTETVVGGSTKKARSDGPGSESTTKEEIDGCLARRPGSGAKETT